MRTLQSTCTAAHKEKNWYPLSERYVASIYLLNRSKDIFANNSKFCCQFFFLIIYYLVEIFNHLRVLYNFKTDVYSRTRHVPWQSYAFIVLDIYLHLLCTDQKSLRTLRPDSPASIRIISDKKQDIIGPQIYIYIMKLSLSSYIQIGV